MVSSLLSITTLFLTGFISTEQWKWDVAVPSNFNSIQFTVSVGDDKIYSELFSPGTIYGKRFENDAILEHFSNCENEDMSFGLKIYTRDINIAQYNAGFVLLNSQEIVNYFGSPTILEALRLYFYYTIPLRLLQTSFLPMLTPPGEISAFYKAGKESDFGLFLPGSDIQYFAYNTDKGVLTALGAGMSRLELGCETKVFGEVPEPVTLLLFVCAFFIIGAKR